MLTANQQQLESVKKELLATVDAYAKSQAEADVNRENFRVCTGIKESLQQKLRCVRTNAGGPGLEPLKPTACVPATLSRTQRRCHPGTAQVGGGAEWTEKARGTAR